MAKSSNRRREVKSLTAVCFEPHLFIARERGHICCGASTLALLTGIPPERIAKKLNRWKHYPDWVMLKFLRSHGFSLHRITSDLVINGGKITTQHVVLISQLLRKGEGTWGVMFGGLFWHNFEMFEVSGLSLLNQPMLTAYIVAHPKYRRFPRWYGIGSVCLPLNARLALAQKLRKNMNRAKR